tara:strand:+ start:10798 stop:11526 length:729 start_codon:yes stop_codon:yes gene_type:complete
MAVELNKIYNEDCLLTMQKMDNNFVDYSLTSPPYNVGKNGLNGEGKKYKEMNDAKSDNDYFENQKEVISELLRVTKFHVFYNIQLLSGNKLSVMKLLGHFADHVKEIIIWNKGYGIPAMEPGVYNSAYEYIIIFSNDQPNKRKFYDTTFRGNQPNVFHIKNKHYNHFSHVHKAVFPLDLPRYFMQLHGKENDIWFDPYIGTGTTAVACLEEKKQYVGSEISQEYLVVANKRIEPYKNQVKLF